MLNIMFLRSEKKIRKTLDPVDYALIKNSNYIFVRIRQALIISQIAYLLLICQIFILTLKYNDTNVAVRLKG